VVHSSTYEDEDDSMITAARVSSYRMWVVNINFPNFVICHIIIFLTSGQCLHAYPVNTWDNYKGVLQYYIQEIKRRLYVVACPLSPFW